MKRAFSIILLLIAFVTLSAQEVVKPDTCIDMKYYKAYYSYEIQTASYCTYTIYNGGGDVPRKRMTFKSGNLPHFNYRHSGYDRGHLVPAEDFAFSYEAEESTFRYFNCVPQTPKLNRGKWKVYEDGVRKLSKTADVFVVVGASDYHNLIPTYCWKAVFVNGYMKYIIVFDQYGNQHNPTYELILFVTECYKKEK